MSQNQSKTMFWAGVILLLINIPAGILGWAVAAAGLAYDRPLVIFLGAVLYSASWLMLGVGIWLAGKKGVAYSKELWNRLLRRR
jgi:hypothetical protein